MKSLQTSLFFVAAVGFLVLCDSAWGFSGSGSGTEVDPYVITDVYQLQEMQNDLAAYYVLGNDIDASGTVSWNGSAGFEPVGNDIDYFTGSFDGLGHTITGLYINRPTERRVGLFGLLKNGGQVMNVGLIAARTYGKYYVGTLAGTSSNQSHIHDCYATGEVTISADGSSDAKSGGLVGNQGYSTISKCYSAVNVTALSSRYQIGGLCGYSRARAGDPPALIENCCSTGTVTSNGWKVGGLLGDADGENSTVSKCYSVGRVNGTHKKGLVGYNWRSPTIRDSYWDTQTSTCSSSYGGAGRTTSEMMKQATFVGWDFDEIWDIDEGQSYPYFMEPRALISLEIVGPNDVAENFSASYKAVAYYENGSTRDVTDSALWVVEPNTAANIDGNGVLTTKDVVNHQSATILASYTEGDVTFEAEKAIDILAICPTGTALQFDGVDDYVYLGDIDEFEFGEDDFSISVWIYPRNHSGSGGHIITKYYWGNEQRQWWLTHSASDAILFYTNPTGASSDGERLASVSPVAQNAWAFITAVRKGSTKYIYINGELDTTGTTAGILTGQSAKVYIGVVDSPSEGLHNFFNGEIDDLRIYNRALDANDIQELMHKKLTGDEPNLVGYWDFDEGEGQIVYDLSGNGNDGQLGSTPEADSSDPAWIESDAPIGICSLYQIATMAADGAVECKTALIEELLATLANEWTAYEALEELLVSGDYGDLYKGDIATAKQKIHSAIQHEGQSIGALDKSVEKLKDALNALGYEPDTAANIDENDVLTTQNIVKDQSVTILASYTEGDVTLDAEKIVNILPNCPGTALQFDGMDDYVDFSRNIITTKEFTVSAWANHHGSPGGSSPVNAIFQQRDDSSQAGYAQSLILLATEYPGDYASAIIRSSGGSSTQRLSYPKKNYDEWHQYSMTVDSTDFTFYIDGVEVDRTSNDQAGDYVTSIDYVSIGRHSYRGANRGLFNGVIDEVAIYNRALSAEEIRANMHTRLAGDEPGLVGYWDFDEGEGQIVYDLSGNGNDGQLGSTPEADSSDPAWIESDAPIGICSLYQIATMAVERALERKLAMLEELLAALASEWTAYEALQEWLENGDYGDLNKGDIVTAKQKIRSAIQHEEQSIDALEKSIEKLEDALSALGYEPEPPVPNQPPNVNITNPQDGAVFGSYQTIEIEANAWDVDGSVVKVEFFADGSKIGEDNDGTDGWKNSWYDHPVDTYSLTAKATDNDGAATTSPAVEITVLEAPLPGQASNPNPANGATNVSISADLSWTAGFGAVSHDVYFGTTSPPPFIHNQTSTTSDPGTMASYTTYYWRIDEVNPSGTTTGTVWTFRTGGLEPPPI